MLHFGSLQTNSFAVRKTDRPFKDPDYWKHVSGSVPWAPNMFHPDPLALPSLEIPALGLSIGQ